MDNNVSIEPIGYLYVDGDDSKGNAWRTQTTVYVCEDCGCLIHHTYVNTHNCKLTRLGG